MTSASDYYTYLSLYTDFNDVPHDDRHDLLLFSLPYTFSIIILIRVCEVSN